MLGQGGNDAVNGTLIEVLDELGRDTTPQFTGTDHRIGQNQCPGSDDRAGSDTDIVEHGRAHADEDIVGNLAAMQADVVTHGDVIADLDPRIVLGTMQARAVLDGDTVTDANLVDIATNDGTEPDRGLGTDNNIADNGSSRGHIRALTDDRGEALKRLNHGNGEDEVGMLD